MRRLLAPLAIVLVTAACAGPTVHPTTTVRSVAIAPSSSSPTTTSSTGSSTTTRSATTTLPTGPPVAWLAPSGVILAVVSAGEGDVELLTPCGNTAGSSSGEPIHEVDVVIDPGHGGPVDTGAVGPNGLEEKEVNLRVALAAGEALSERGINVALTRTGDYPIPIRTRVEYARLMDAEVMVSIHHNAPTAPSSEVPGVEIFVQQDSAESQRLGGLLYDAAMGALGAFDVDWDRAPDAGVMTVVNSEGNDAYGMVRLPDMPSALVELGYIVNGAEADLFRTPGYVSSAGTSVADAIESFLSGDRTGAGLVEGRTFNPQPGVGRDQCVEPDLERSLYPDVTDVRVTRRGAEVAFEVTVSSPYDTADRYADGFRIVGDDGEVYGVRELTHDHANEQPFTRNLGSVEIPATVEMVTVEARDSVYGWGGRTASVVLP